jgi:hypothetical protein
MGGTAEENTENISVLAGSLCRELQGQSVSLLARLNCRVQTQQYDYSIFSFSILTLFLP